ncbi:MAG: hypothetical protein K2X27_19960 [Candidatus Obscuribacterales bacterium]|nr:hypothetical protein [Candidatus Obscuribacterales bacterium]
MKNQVKQISALKAASLVSEHKHADPVKSIVALFYSSRTSVLVALGFATLLSVAVGDLLLACAIACEMLIVLGAFAFHSTKQSSSF